MGEVEAEIAWLDRLRDRGDDMSTILDDRTWAWWATHYTQAMCDAQDQAANTRHGVFRRVHIRAGVRYHLAALAIARGLDRGRMNPYAARRAGGGMRETYRFRIVESGSRRWSRIRRRLISAQPDLWAPRLRQSEWARSGWGI